MDRRRSVLVTGASGFIGHHLVEALLEQGARVIALTRPSSVLSERWADRVDRVDCHDWTLAGVDRALGSRDFDGVFHLASYGVRPAERDAATMSRINIDVAVDLVRLCRPREAGLVIAGSSAEYRETGERVPLQEDAPLETVKLYGASKAVGGHRATALAQELGVSLCVLRLFNVYGAGEAPHRLLPSLAAGLGAGRPVALSAGTQVRDFIYVADVVKALVAAEAQVTSHQKPLTATWNVCTGQGTSVRDFAVSVAEILGGKARLRFGEIPMRDDETPWLVGSAARVKAELGWSARYDLAAGLRASLVAMSSAMLATGGAR